MRINMHRRPRSVSSGDVSHFTAVDVSIYQTLTRKHLLRPEIRIKMARMNRLNGRQKTEMPNRIGAEHYSSLSWVQRGINCLSKPTKYAEKCISIRHCRFFPRYSSASPTYSYETSAENLKNVRHELKNTWNSLIYRLEMSFGDSAIQKIVTFRYMYILKSRGF